VLWLEYYNCLHSMYFFLLHLYLFAFFIFGFFRAALMAYGSSQARGGIRMTTASLCHSHSNEGSFDPLSEARDPTCLLTDAHQLCCRRATGGTPIPIFITQVKSWSSIMFRLV